MAIKWMIHAWDRAPVSGSKLLLLLALADYAGESGESWHPLQTLADRARVSCRHAQRLIRELEQEGYLVVDDRQRDNGSSSTNIYRLLRWWEGGVTSTSGGVTSTSPPPDTHVTPQGDTHVTPPLTPMSPQGDTHVTPRGDTHVTPLTVIEPTVNPQGEPSSSNRQRGGGGGGSRIADEGRIPQSVLDAEPDPWEMPRQPTTRKSAESPAVEQLARRWEMVVNRKRPRDSADLEERWMFPLRSFLAERGGDVDSALQALVAERRRMLAEGLTPVAPSTLTYRIATPGSAEPVAAQESEIDRNMRIALERYHEKRAMAG